MEEKTQNIFQSLNGVFEKLNSKRKIKKILQRVSNGTLFSTDGLSLTRDDLLTKDKNGVYLLQYLFDNNVIVYLRDDAAKKDSEIAYLFLKNKKDLTEFKFDENSLFSTINGKRLIDYMVENRQLNENIVKTIKNDVEIINLIISADERYLLKYLSPEIIDKLMTTDENGTYYIENYLNNVTVMNAIIPMINDENKLIELCNRKNNYDLMKYVNKKVLMANYKSTTILNFLINEKHITPYILHDILYNDAYNDVSFIQFLINNKLYSCLQDASERILLLPINFEGSWVASSNTLLNTLINNGYDPKFNFNIHNEKTITILYKNHKLNLIKSVSDEIALTSIKKLFQDDSLNDKSLLEYMIDNNFDINPLYTSNENIIKILYQRQRPDLMDYRNVDFLLKIFIDDSNTYFDYILDCIKNGKINYDKNIFTKPHDFNLLVKYYLIIAKHDMLGYIEKISKAELLSEYNNMTLIEYLLNSNTELTLNKILSDELKSDPNIAVILKSRGISQKSITISKDKDERVQKYIDNTKEYLSIGPLPEEGENLLKELQQLFLSDGKSDKDLIQSLIIGYRNALVFNYNISINEIKSLIEIKKQHFNRFYYLRSTDGSYFDFRSVFCSNSSIHALLHETGHALHRYAAGSRKPNNYYEIIEKARKNPETLIKFEEFVNTFSAIIDKTTSLVEKKYMDFFKDYYNDEKIKEIETILTKSKKEKKEEYQNLNIPEKQLDTILCEMYTVQEYIEHQKRMFIYETTSSILKKEFGSLFFICDIIDGIYEGKIYSGILKNGQNQKIKRIAGHGIYYYNDKDNVFDEMIANFSAIVKSNNSGDDLEKLKNIVGEELYDMINNFYHQDILKVNIEKNIYHGGR